jgi:hypothetical protein
VAFGRFGLSKNLRDEAFDLRKKKASCDDVLFWHIIFFYGRGQFWPE